MYRGYDDSYGRGPTIYREPNEIRGDIGAVRERIAEINARLNARELTFEIISRAEGLRPSGIVSVLEDILAEAEEAASELRTLSDELSLLEEELYEVKCEIGMN